MVPVVLMSQRRRDLLPTSQTTTNALIVAHYRNHSKVIIPYQTTERSNKHEGSIALFIVPSVGVDDNSKGAFDKFTVSGGTRGKTRSTSITA
jgi:hypothetical protein